MRHKNSFDFIRFVAASAVVLTHAFALSGRDQPHIGSITLGGVSVWAFFILSGYLISASWDQYPRFNVFFAKRALRIFPGLIVALFLTVVVCGFFYSTLGLLGYFRSPGTIAYFNNVLLINTQYSLPGVFSHNIYPNAVNGSLWTLAYEFLMYLALAFFGVIRLFKKMPIEVFWVFLFALQIITIIGGFQHFDFFILYFQFNLLITMGLMFFTGVLIQKKVKSIPLRPLYGLGAAILFIAVVTIVPKITELAAATILAYSLFALGSSPHMSWFGRYGDFSYGIYIYHFPIMQMVVASTGTHTPFRLFAVVWPISVIAGATSWWLVESRFLKLKKKINLNKYPVPQVEAVW